MTDEKQGDELFEDLDKFFAPIRDVDWDEPDESPRVDPSEEHVAVRTEAEPPAQAPAPDAPAPEVPQARSEDEDAWYDTQGPALRRRQSRSR